MSAGPAAGGGARGSEAERGCRRDDHAETARFRQIDSRDSLMAVPRSRQDAEMDMEAIP
jgi:hypothetical protein